VRERVLRGRCLLRLHVRRPVRGLQHAGSCRHMRPRHRRPPRQPVAVHRRVPRFVSQRGRMRGVMRRHERERLYLSRGRDDVPERRRLRARGQRRLQRYRRGGCRPR
jgi:hypothetical protein